MTGILIVIATRTHINILCVIWLRSENKSEDCDRSINPIKRFILIKNSQVGSSKSDFFK